MIAELLSPVANHLWQSTAVACAAALLTLVVRKNSARVRYWIWVFASFKFLVPFSLLMALGNQVHWRTAAPMQASVPVVIDQVGESFTAAPTSPAVPNASGIPGNLIVVIVSAVWACGLLGVAWSRCVQYRRIARVVRRARPVELRFPVKTMCSPLFMEPAVYGVFRPVLLLPEGLLDHLTPEQFKAVVAHELCHVRYRDNLIALIQTLVEAAFWFHPLVWWIGKRMLDERERACDQEVLRLGAEDRIYAQGILKVCRLCLESPLACISGVTGANLKRRIEAILNATAIEELNRRTKLLLAASSIAATVVPVAIGIVNAPPISAQARTAALPMFEVVSIRASDPKLSDSGGFKSKGGPGVPLGPAIDVEHTRFSAANINLLQLIVRAYALNGCPPGPRVVDCPLFSGGPDWGKRDRFDIQAKMPDGSPEYTTMQLFRGQAPQLQLMLQALLAERFNLKVHRVKKQLPVYALTVGKKLKLKTAKDGETEIGPLFRPMTEANGETTIEMVVQNRSMQDVADTFSAIFNRPVLERTGLKGKYDLTMQYEGNADQPGPFTELIGPGLFTAFQEQAGLKLEATKASIDVLVIDQAQRPSEN
jgi:uncharacterized protein (TIGR03435 family)